MKIIIITILLMFACVVYADNQNQTNDNLYQVNVIVFEHIAPNALNSELWPDIINPPNITNAVTPDLLPDNKSQLRTEIRKLKNRNDYKVLVSMAWQQQIPVTNKAQPIHIVGGENYNGTYQLDGTITINRTRYFNVSTNLVLTELTSYLNSVGPGNYAQDTIKSDFKSFQMHQKLRLRSNELGYIDHPLFGLLIEIMPINPPNITT